MPAVEDAHFAKNMSSTNVATVQRTFVKILILTRTKQLPLPIPFGANGKEVLMALRGCTFRPQNECSSNRLNTERVYIMSRSKHELTERRLQRCSNSNVCTLIQMSEEVIQQTGNHLKVCETILTVLYKKGLLVRKMYGDRTTTRL